MGEAKVGNVQFRNEAFEENTGVKKISSNVCIRVPDKWNCFAGKSLLGNFWYAAINSFTEN